MARGIGVAATLPAEIVREAAEAAEQRGYSTFWVNDTPAGDGLQQLAEAAKVTSRIGLGVGVLALDRHPTDHIIARVRELGLPEHRLQLGVGSGGAPNGLERVRAALGPLRDAFPGRVIVAALGPRMLQLAGEAADGVLLNWLTLDYARQSGVIVRTAAEQSGNGVPRLLGYVRTALPEGANRLKQEAAFYNGLPQYNAHFQRMGVDPYDTAVAGDHAAIQDTLSAFEQLLDEVTARVVTAHDTEKEILEVVRAAAPA